MRVRQLKAELVNYLKERDIESPFLEVSLFVRKITSWTKTEELVFADKELDVDKELEIRRLVQMRGSHIPTSYILNEKEFFNLTFTVTNDTLIPRPDTEILVEEAIRVIKKEGYKTALDLCTGTGAVGISIANNTDLEIIHLSDISEKALSVASINAEKLLKNSNIKLFKSDLFSELSNIHYDIIAANPPYVTKEQYNKTSQEVKKEPITALISPGNDGLDIIRRIIKESKKHLNNNGTLLFECDYRQAKTCAKLLDNEGFVKIRILKDLSGLERVVGGMLCIQS